jgi:Protein of unknown function (DUF3300)
MIFAIRSVWFRWMAVICAVLMMPGDTLLFSQEQSSQAKPETDAPKLKSADQLDSLVAPIALYPDPLLGQVLAASTYPVEIVEANRWLKANSTLKGENLTKAAAKQTWDASVQALVAFPGALKRLDENIRWTTELGNAVLDQQTDVMDAIQRMRSKAKDGGKLQSTKEQKVEVKTVESKTVIEIQPANPQVIYVPSYDPVVVYGAAPVYAYPPYYPTAGAVAATAAVSFGVGVMMGAFWGGCCGGGWGWGCSWGGTANININNNFHNRYGYNNINNINGGNRVNGGNRWQHNPTHRRATPYSNARTAQRFGGTARGSRGDLQRFDSRTGDGRGGDRAGLDRGSADRRGGGDRAGDRGGDRGADRGADRGRSGGRDGTGNQDRVGNRSIDNGNRGSRNSALGGGESRSRAQASSDRGFSSSRGGGGGGGGRSAGGGGSGRSSGGGRSFGGGGRRR